MAVADATAVVHVDAIRSFLRSFVYLGVGAPTNQAGFRPVDTFVAELKKELGHLALFYFDAVGGDKVGLVWHPSAFLPRPLRINDLQETCPIASGDASGAGGSHQQLAVPNVVEVLARIQDIGKGLVGAVELANHA